MLLDWKILEDLDKCLDMRGIDYMVSESLDGASLSEMIKVILDPKTASNIVKETRNSIK